MKNKKEKVKKEKVKRVSAVKLQRRQRRCLWSLAGGGAASLLACICTFGACHAQTEYWCMCSLGSYMEA